MELQTCAGDLWRNPLRIAEIHESHRCVGGFETFFAVERQQCGD